MTSSPGPMPAAINPKLSAAVPAATPNRVLRPAEPREVLFERVDLGSVPGVALRQDAVDHRYSQLVRELRVLAAHVDEGHLARARLLLGAHEQVYLREVAASFANAELRWLLTAVVAR